MNASTGTSARSTEGSFSIRRNVGLASTTAIPASTAIVISGSWRSSTASSVSSRSAAKTARGATRTDGALTHQLTRRTVASRVVDADRELTEQVAAAAPYTGFLGMEIVSASSDEVRSRLAWRKDKCTAGGMLHGGALMSLADSAGGFLAFLNLAADAKGT